ncbi:NYN domain-containing protein [Phenylobacterium soli]|uniref:NYN domain-containing protein n=1 Tax=Phenylobacterium soli TaxID=2170551 RepID=A0A328AH25_9CAUL|nr:NYN domain-containing protein [Phenylobacterium soli]RAK54082.1 hypothetical protein DJ017_05875 [Phenylobacterium soli]
MFQPVSESLPNRPAYMFVDGACLQEMIQAASERYLEPGFVFEIDYRALRGTHAKVYYYDAIPRSGADASDEQIEAKAQELGLIGRQDGYHVRSGEAVRRKKAWTQKMVDVQLAVDMMSLAARGMYSSATLITGDLDFKPLVDALVDLGLDITLIYPAGHTNNDLIAAADRAVEANVDWFFACATQRFLKAYPSPQYQFNHRATDMRPAAPGELVHAWQADGWGECRLLSRDGLYEVITSEIPEDPHHFLWTRFDRIARGRLWTLARFGLVLPEEVTG